MSGKIVQPSPDASSEQGEFGELLKAIEAEPVPDNLLALAMKLQDALRQRSQAAAAPAGEAKRAPQSRAMSRV